MALTEAQTRKGLINKQLKISGWDINDRTRVIEEFDIQVDLSEGVQEARTQYEGHQFINWKRSSNSIANRFNAGFQFLIGIVHFSDAFMTAK